MKQRKQHTFAWLRRHKNYTLGRTSYIQMLELAALREAEAKRSTQEKVE